MTDGLIGRDIPVARLGRLVDALASGSGGSVWVEGEPGIGKSSVLAAGLASAVGRGCAVFWSAGEQLAQRFPLLTLLDCLQVRGGAGDPDRVEIDRLLRGGNASGAAPRDRVAATAEQLLVLVQRLCVASPVLLVVDDLQWADDATLTMWARLHALVGQLPLLLVAACRPLPLRESLAALRTELVGSGVEMIRLAPLEPQQVAWVVDQLVHGRSGPRLRALAGRAGGNPLLLRELVDALSRDGALHAADGVIEVNAGTGDLPSISAAITDRLSYLSPDATAGLRLAAVLGVEFSRVEMDLVSAGTTWDLAGVLREASAAGVLREDLGDRLGFRHGLIQQALHDAIPAALRPALHVHAAQALAEAAAPIERVAEQLLAGTAAMPRWAIRWLTEAAPALAYRAPEVAVVLLERARARTRGAGPGVLDTGLVTALYLLDRYEDVERVARPALASLPDAQTRGAMVWTLCYAMLHADKHAAAHALAEDVLREGGLGELWTPRIQAMHAITCLTVGRRREAAGIAAEVAACAHESGDRFAEGYALHVLSLAQAQTTVSRMTSQSTMSTIEQALAVIGDDPGLVDLRLLLLDNLAEKLIERCEWAQARRCLTTTITLAERVGSALRQARLHGRLAHADYLTGHWDDAVTELDNAVRLARSQASVLVNAHGVAALMAFHRDQRETLEHHMSQVYALESRIDHKESLEGRSLLTHIGVVEALRRERAGDQRGAAQRLAAKIDRDNTDATPDIFQRAPDAVRLALATGDTAVARRVTARCSDHAEERPDTAMSAQHCQALLANDADAVLTAADAYRFAGLALYGAQAAENAAVLYAQRGALDAARRAYTRAIDTYTTMGAAWDIRRADTRLRPHGIRRGQRGPRGERREATGWGALTPSEARIAELVAAGNSNPDIAAQLFLSRRTVQTHVSHILDKLGAHSRVDIARLAARPRQETPG
jgi:DNA-binding CsgD family transcriptional regulator